MPQVNKNHWREREIWVKRKTRPRMIYECIEKTIWKKKSDPNNRKKQ